MSNYIHVYLNADSDAMVGSAGWDGHNEKDSIAAYAQQVEQEIIVAYPDADVEVETYAAKRTITSDIDGVEDDVIAIIETVWNSWEWLRK